MNTDTKMDYENGVLWTVTFITEVIIEGTGELNVV